MDQKLQSAANRVYQDFEPYFEWAEEEESATLIVILPGFNRDQMRVQLTTTPVLRINGERQVTENIWRRFTKEFAIPSYCDTNELSARFERGILYIKFPKLITPDKSQEEPTSPLEVEAPMPQQQQSGADDEFHEAPEAQEVDQQKPPQKDKEPESGEKEKKKTEELAAAGNKVVADDQKKVRTNGVSETAEATTSKAHEKEGTKMTQRLKTRELDLTPSNLKPADKVQDVNQGCLIKGRAQRSKILMNMIVTILLIVVLGMYLKNAFRSSLKGSKFQEF